MFALVVAAVRRVWAFYSNFAFGTSIWALMVTWLDLALARFRQEFLPAKRRTRKRTVRILSDAGKDSKS